MFWLAAAVLTVLAVAPVARVLFDRRPASGGDRAQAVKRLYQDRLEELRRERDAGIVPAEALPEIERELAGVLLDDFRDEDLVAGTAEAGAGSGRGWTTWVFIVLVPLAGFGMYRAIGEPEARVLADAIEVLALDPAADAVALDEWRLFLTGRVAAAPDDAQSWYLLGHVHLRQADYGAAASAFGSAHGLVGSDASVDLYWLQARYLAAGGVLDSTSRAIAERLQGATPNQPLVLEMQAVDAFRRGEFRESVGLLERALGAARDPGQVAALEAGLDEARSRLGDLLPAIQIEIGFASPPPAGATLFVIARPVGGGMPFAAVRRPAGRSEEKIRLDDAVSMNPAAPLSAAVQVEVVVRVSLAGTPAAHPGDWEWTSQALDLTDAGVIELAASLAPPRT